MESIDKVETAQALEAACAAAGRTLEILLEMNTSGEATKFGFAERRGRCWPPWSRSWACRTCACGGS